MNDKPTETLAARKHTVHDLINSDRAKAEIAKVLPKHLTPERMVRVALTATLRNPALLQCSPESLMNALLVCSQAGLEPDGRLAHLIPFKDQVQVIFDYKGLVTLALRNGAELVYADTVRETDKFEAYVQDGIKKIRHKPNWSGDRGKAVRYYAVCKRNGETDWEVMSVAEVEAIRARSRAAKSGPWVTDFDEMAKKTVLRRMSKRWDLLPDIRDIIFADDDGPDPLTQAPMARPIFDTPAAKLTNGNGAPPPAPPPPAAAPEPPPPEPPPSVPPETEDGDLGPQTQPDKPGFSPLRALRGLCRMASINEGRLLDYVAGAGATDGSVATLEELVTAYEPVAEMLCDDWSNVAAMIKAAAKKGAKP